MARKIVFTSILLLLVFHGFSQMSVNNFDYDGENRSYNLYVPNSYDPGNTHPVVFALHGLGDNPSNFSGVGFNALANQDGWLVVYPAALPEMFTSSTAWNSGTLLNSTVDDVGFISAVLDTLIANYSVDEKRVYATGFSMGSMMSHRLGCELSDRIAAVAGVSGPIVSSIMNACPNDRPYPAMHIHGTADQVVAISGNALYGTTSADQTIEHYTTLASCTGNPVLETLPDNANDGRTVEKSHWTSCEDSAEVILYTVFNGQHEWPFVPNNDFSASSTIWEFFKRHRLRESNVASGIDEIIESVSLYPNPFKDELSFETNNRKIQKFSLLNMLGEQVWESQQNEIDQLASGKITLDTKAYDKGVYFLMVETSDDVAAIRVVKQQ